jgi:hypothetical protein
MDKLMQMNTDEEYRMIVMYKKMIEVIKDPSLDITYVD